MIYISCLYVFYNGYLLKFFVYFCLIFNRYLYSILSSTRLNLPCIFIKTSNKILTFFLLEDKLFELPKIEYKINKGCLPAKKYIKNCSLLQFLQCKFRLFYLLFAPSFFSATQIMKTKRARRASIPRLPAFFLN